MSAKFSFRLTSEIKTHPLPPKILISQHALESTQEVVLKLLARVVFSRDRLQLEPRLHDENIPFVPSLIQMSYELRPALWIEVGDCPVDKLDKLAVKANEAEIWVVLSNPESLSRKLQELSKHRLRTGRYRLMCFPDGVVDEMVDLLAASNNLILYHLDVVNGAVQFEFNGLWFDVELTRRDH